ncbi:putative F-box protein At2g02030 [Silene latifolia]|uniref:putative F-box protein At2g02030 n=1 Tax=Silene latifolia TaxID=37657 RepID=UPI003D77FFC1
MERDRDRVCCEIHIYGVKWETEMALSLEQYRDIWKENPTIKNILTKRIERQRKKALGFSINIGNQIPAHLIIEILSRLPVKALLQFKSVCKLWYDIIKSSHFISKHLRNYYDDNNNWRDCLIVQYSSVGQAGALIAYELLIDDTKNRTVSYQRIETPVYNSLLCGPCDGIYLVWSSSVFNPKRSLWNPALNEFKILPNINCWKPNLPSNPIYIGEAYGFGYDSKTDDYKVILILYYGDTLDDISRITINPMSILIYSLRTNSWRHWGDMDNSYYLEPNGSYVFVNGCYYWLASRLLTHGWDTKIFSFDLNAETCQEIPLPQFESEPKYSQLIVYQDSIGFVYVPDDDNTRFNVYTWNNGVWTQKLSIKLDFEVWGTFSQWKDNMLVFTHSDLKLVLLDTNTKEIFILAKADPRACQWDNICAYKESLVSINDFGRTLCRRQICEDVRYLNNKLLPNVPVLD